MGGLEARRGKDSSFFLLFEPIVEGKWQRQWSDHEEVPRVPACSWKDCRTVPGSVEKGVFVSYRKVSLPVGTWKKSARVPLSELYSPQPGFPGGSVVKNLSANAGDTGSISRLGRSPGGGNGNPLQYSCQENPMERRAQWATVCGVAKELDTTEWLSMQWMAGPPGPLCFSQLFSKQQIFPFLEWKTWRGGAGKKVGHLDSTCDDLSLHWPHVFRLYLMYHTRGGECWLHLKDMK